MQSEDFKISILFARHGETYHNKSKTIAGQQNGKLTSVGETQARKIGKHLNGKKFDQIYVSDLGRTKETFENAVKEAPNLKQCPTVFQPLIRERGAGIFEEKPLNLWGETAEKEGKDIRDFKCQGGESWKDVMERGRKFLKEVVECVKEKHQNKEEVKVLGITHGGFIMEFHNVRRICSNEKQLFDNTAKNCSMHEFQIRYPREEKEFDEKKVKLVCSVKNFVGHLQ